MKTITIKAYTFKELPENIQDKVMDGFRCDQEFHWSEEYIESLKWALDFFNFELSNYNIDWNNFSGSDIRIKSRNDDEIDELTGTRLYKYLINNFSTAKTKHGNVKTFEGNCAFTGFCSDEDFLDPINEFLKKPSTKYNFYELIEECASNLLLAGCNDFEYQQSDEAIIEMINSNDYYFDVYGDIV